MTKSKPTSNFILNTNESGPFHLERLEFKHKMITLNPYEMSRYVSGFNLNQPDSSQVCSGQQKVKQGITMQARTSI